MKLKKLLSVLLIMTMVLSVCSAVQADYTYFIPLNKFSSSENLNVFTLDHAKVSLTDDAGESVLKMNKPESSSAFFYSSKYNTTGASGIVYEFDIKQLSNNSKPSGINVYMNSNTNSLFFLINDKGEVKYKAGVPAVYTLNKDNWYNISIKVNYEDKRVYGIIKDASGNIVHSGSHEHTDGNIKSEMAGKADSSILFQTGSSVTGDIFYMDNFSVRALEAGELDTLPVSITKTIVEENYDGLNPDPVVFSSGAGKWSYVMSGGKSGWENCLDEKGVVVGGYLGSASIKEATTGSSDKYLEFNLNASSDSSMDYMYSSTLYEANYIQEVTFKVEENVKNMDFRYRVNKNNITDIFVGRLDFSGDTVYLGTSSSPINAEFDFVPGTEYTAKVYYAWDAHKGKIEITDGTKSVVLQGDLNGNKNTVDTIEAPYIRFASDNNCNSGRKISIYNYNIYTTDERSCELKTRYSNLKLSKNAFEEGKIIASVDAESNASFANYVNGAATLFLAVYENGKLAELKSVKVSPENKTFSVENTIGANDTSVKAMVWNVDDGTLTPLFVSKELTKQ